ncbi:MAG: hypothetical protein ACK5PG_08380 [Lysobacterales bacterium]
MRLLPAAALFLLSHASPTQAEDVVTCVGTVAELEAAIDAATVDLPFVSRRLIRLEQGSYNLSSSDFMRTSTQATGFPLREPVVLAGGYTAGCSGRVLNPSNTVLTNTGTRRLDFEVLRDLIVSGLTFANFANEIEFSHFDLDDTLQRIEVANSRFVGGSGGIRIQVESGNGTSEIRFRNNLVWNRPGDGQCTLRLLGDSGPDTVVRLVASSNTVAANGAAGDGVCIGQIEQPQLYNNIFHLNPGDDLSGLGGNGLTVARNNLFQSVAGISYAVGGNTGNSNANPLFVNVLDGDLRLGSGSPGINSGFDSPTYGNSTVDIGGLTRVVGPAIDRGAHESANAGTVNIAVTNAGNAGAGTLREAILQANATPGFNRITFNIPGSGCPKVISVTSELPGITDTVHIDGGTQPGFEANTSELSYDGTMCVLLRGPDNAFGFRVPVSAPASTRLTVDSIAFGGFSYGVLLEGGASHLVIGSQFGVPLPSSNAMEGGVFISAAPSTQVGGADAGSRNVFANLDSGGLFTSAGVLVGETSTGSVIVNNFFGNLPNGVSEGPIDHGIVSFADGVEIDDNLINNATAWAIRIHPSASGTVISRNRLGLPSFCIGNCPTAQANTRGMLIEGEASNLWLNDVANSLANGVRVTGNDNALFRVQVYGGLAGVAPIDIGPIGFTGQQVNTVTNPVPGNRSLNWPQLTSLARLPNGDWQVSGTLASANGSYGIDFYGSPRRVDAMAPTARCEGRVFIGNLVGPLVIANASPGMNGTVNFLATIPSALATLPLITAVARRETVIEGAVRDGDSSEYGNCLELPLFSNGFES